MKGKKLRRVRSLARTFSTNKIKSSSVLYDTKINKPNQLSLGSVCKSKRQQKQVSRSAWNSETGTRAKRRKKSVAFDVTNKLKWVHSSGSSSLPQKQQKSKLPRKRKRNFSRVKLEMYDNPITNGFARRDFPLSVALHSFCGWNISCFKTWSSLTPN